jgi:hypothetical protein
VFRVLSTLNECGSETLVARVIKIKRKVAAKSLKIISVAFLYQNLRQICAFFLRDTCLGCSRKRFVDFRRTTEFEFLMKYKEFSAKFCEILGNFAQKRRKYKKRTEFRVEGILRSPYTCLF